MRSFMIAILAVFLLGGCKKQACDPERYANCKPNVHLSRYEIRKNQLDTEKVFHYLVLKPNFFRLDFPSFLIGIEKSLKETVGRLDLGQCDEIDGPCLNTASAQYAAHQNTVGWINRLFGVGLDWTRDIKVHLPTHIAWFGNTPGCSELIYNVYGTQCDGKAVPPPWGRFDLHDRGWHYIQNMRDRLREKIRTTGATHILFMTMGWNTPQWEAMTNFTDLFNGIKEKAEKEGVFGDTFKPLVICITWPAYWYGKGEDPLGQTSDYITIRDDVDAIAVSLVNLVIQGVIGPLKREAREQGNPPLKIVLLGHSLGSRLITRAADSGYLITNEPEQIDLVIGLEGASNAMDFLEQGKAESLHFFNRLVRHSYYTASIHDSATALPSKFLQKHHIGSYSTFWDIHGINQAVASGKRKISKKEWKLSQLFHTIVLDESGYEENTGTLPVSDSIVFADASSIIHKNVPGTGGDAHNDIYNKEVSTFIWTAIRASTIDKQ